MPFGKMHQRCRNHRRNQKQKYSRAKGAPLGINGTEEVLKCCIIFAELQNAQETKDTQDPQIKDRHQEMKIERHRRKEIDNAKVRENVAATAFKCAVLFRSIFQPERPHAHEIFNGEEKHTHHFDEVKKFLLRMNTWD